MRFLAEADRVQAAERRGQGRGICRRELVAAEGDQRERYGLTAAPRHRRLVDLRRDAAALGDRREAGPAADLLAEAGEERIDLRRLLLVGAAGLGPGGDGILIADDAALAAREPAQQAQARRLAREIGIAGCTLDQVQRAGCTCCA
jgi:hypothetical protein